MLTNRILRKGRSAKHYFAQDMAAGEWDGQGVDALGVTGQVTKAAFARAIEGVHPATGKKLTPRRNTTRKVRTWKLNEVTGRWVPAEYEVLNRRVGIDWTYSMPKGVSVLYALTKDPAILGAFMEVNQRLCQGLMECLSVRVRVDGADYDRASGVGLCARFLHMTARPVEGIADPLVHAHNVIFNLAYDAVEERWKAAQFGPLLANQKRYRADADRLFAQKLEVLGHKVRWTKDGFDLAMFTDDELKAFSRRSTFLDGLEETLHSELENRAAREVRKAARKGRQLDPAKAYAGEKGKLASEHRDPKGTTRLTGESQEAEWRSRLSPERLAAIMGSGAPGRAVATQAMCDAREMAAGQPGGSLGPTIGQ